MHHAIQWLSDEERDRQRQAKGARMVLGAFKAN